MLTNINVVYILCIVLHTVNFDIQNMHVNIHIL